MIKNSRFQRGSKIAEMPQKSTQKLHEGYEIPQGRVKGILRHLRKPYPENAINSAYTVLLILGVLKGFKRV